MTHQPGQDHPKGFKHLRSGSSKEIYRVDDKTLAFGLTDFFSVFDVGRSADVIPGKGAAICKTAVAAFKVAQKIGVPTHFVEQIDDTTIRVREAQIITGRPISLQEENYVVPAEWIYRLRNAGSIDRDFRSGKKRPEDYGLLAGVIPKIGKPFPYPIHMLTTKFEQFDRDLSEAELCNTGGVTVKDIREYWSMVDRLTGAIALQAHRAGFVILDGKLELGMGIGRQKMVLDVFATQDEDRPAKITPDGKTVHHSKEYLRQYYIELGYKKALDEARKAGLADPPMPRLPEAVIFEVKSLYEEYADAFANAAL